MTKRVFDLLLGIISFFSVSPLLASLALFIRIVQGKPVFFKQTRPGLNGQPFSIYKFRTMIDKWGGDGKLLPDSDRLTKLGRFLRCTSLDELPELLNVLKGEMSLVGPRPLLMRYMERYTSEQRRRHEVRPGITGWAQVNGRNAINWEDKFKLDVWYVDHKSFALDFKIITMTVLKTIRREGVNQAGHATMEEFMGQ